MNCHSDKRDLIIFLESAYEQRFFLERYISDGLEN